MSEVRDGASGGDSQENDGRPRRSGLLDRVRDQLSRRTFLGAVGAATAAGVASTGSTDATVAQTAPTGVTGIHGAMYLPAKDWNAYQMWANYDETTIEQELDMAASLGLNSVRVLGSYYRWVEDGPGFFGCVEHFLTECEKRGIRPIIVLFEAAPKHEPTEANRTATDPENAFAVHSPSREQILQPRNWSGFARSPLHFARRWAQTFGEDPRLLATEIMNEPGDVQPRQDFANDMLAEVREHARSGTLTMGCKDFRFNAVYDQNDALDVHQFHMNLPADQTAAEEYLARAKEHRTSTGKPLWCTEWQRTRFEPPRWFLPNYQSLASTVKEAHAEGSIDGDFFWGLMVKPAYLRDPRQGGRINGVFHVDGTPFVVTDRDALARETSAAVDDVTDSTSGKIDSWFSQESWPGETRQELGP